VLLVAGVAAAIAGGRDLAPLGVVRQVVTALGKELFEGREELGLHSLFEKAQVLGGALPEHDRATGAWRHPFLVAPRERGVALALARSAPQSGDQPELYVRSRPARVSRVNM
jgi:hypothetical protein